jgi:quinoprotein glucose dehydrogenase
VDPDGVLYVNGNEMPWVLTMVEARPREGGQTTVEQLYRMLCGPCHGLDLQGNPAQQVPTLMGVEDRLDREAVAEQVRIGKGAMPSFGFLSEGQRNALADYVLGKVGGNARAEDSAVATTRLGGIPYSHTGYNRWLDTNGYPAVKPPWGTLNAIDLNTGEYRWRTTLGEVPELMERGIPPTGTENYGGPVVTAGGILFIAASRDEHIRAFDTETGEELWKTRLPAGGYATPATYSIDGRQFVVIACGGGKMGTKSGDSYVAFSLPE